MQQKLLKKQTLLFVTGCLLCNQVLSSCISGQFECADGTCITNSLQCDSSFDCPDSSDELNCGPGTNCPEGQTRCSDGSCKPDCLTTEESVTSIVGITPKEDNGLGPGTIAGIVIGCIGGIIIIIFIVFVYNKCKRK